MSSAIRRFAVGIEYDGTRYAGWQHQPGRQTIQECVQNALSAVADHPVQVAAAGRTDELGRTERTSAASERERPTIAREACT